jgi:hypothetical protein
VTDSIRDIETAPLHTLSAELIRQAIGIYEDSFPRDERVPSESLLEAIQHPDPHRGCPVHHQALLAGNVVVGIGIILYSQPYRLGYLEYLAVRSGSRSSGLGSRFYQALVELVKQDGQASPQGPAQGVVLEVERPEDALNEAERILRTRRIGFYLRNGAVQIPHLDLTAPPLHPGAAPVPYHILVHPLEELQWDRRLRKAVVATILGQGYGLPAGNPYYQAALKSVNIG